MNKRFFSTKFYVIVALVFAFFSLYAWTRPAGEGTDVSTEESPSLIDQEYTTQSTRQFRFATVGDFDYNENTRSVFDLIAKSNTDFSIGLGDYSYDKTKSEYEWCDLVTTKLGKNYAFQLTAGNHDVHENGNKQDVDRFASCLPNKMPAYEGIYAQQGFFDYGRMARFITVAPGMTINGRKYSYEKDSVDYKWLSDTIDDARSDRLSWVIVSMHKNCITIGEKTCEIGEDIMTLLAQKKIDLILQGHEHGYFRSHQLRSSESCPQITIEFKQSCVIESETSMYEKGSGPLLAIVGTGGAEVRSVNVERPESGYFADYSGSNLDPVYGPLIVDVTRSSLKASFVGTDGQVHDEFRVE